MPRGKYVRSEETRKKLSESLKGTWTKDRRQKQREARTGANNPNYGRVYSPEQLEQMRQRMLLNNPMRGRRITPEQSAKLSQLRKGKSTLLGKYGVTPELYAAAISAGNRWCFYGKHFASSVEFGKGGCCNTCLPKFRRRSDLKKKYNLTQEDYLRMLEEQDGVCAICGVTEQSARRKHMMIDHNHTTGAVRGILCGPCNTAVERLETVPNWGILAAQYLAKF